MDKESKMKKFIILLLLIPFVFLINGAGSHPISGGPIGAGSAEIGVATAITDGIIVEADFDTTNAAVDNYVLSYDAATGTFTWVDPGTTTDDQTAAEVVVTPAGDIAAIQVQAALEELDTEKAPLTSPTLVTPTLGTPASGTLTNCTGLPTAGISDANAGTDITADLEEEVTEGSLADSTIVSADIKDGAIVNADINAAAAIDGSKLSITSFDITVASGKLLVGNASNLAEAQTPSGAVTMSNAGVFQGYAKTPLAGTAADFDDNFTGAYLYGGTYRVTTAGACALPEATVGMYFTILHEVAGASTIESLTGGTADTIFMNGLSAGSDDDLTASAVGAMCVFQYQAANVWMALCNDFTEVAP